MNVTVSYGVRLALSSRKLIRGSYLIARSFRPLLHFLVLADGYPVHPGDRWFREVHVYVEGVRQGEAFVLLFVVRTVIHESTKFSRG